MSPSTLRILIAVFFIAHGWIHFSLTTVPVPAPGALRTPFWPSWKRTDIDPLWPAARLKLAPAAVRTLGSILWAAALAGFCLAGLSLLVLPGTPLVWQSTAVIGSAASLILLALYWHPWLPVGVLIDLAVIAAIAFHWPAALFSN